MDEKSYKIVMEKLINELNFNARFIYENCQNDDYAFSYKKVCEKILELITYFAHYEAPANKEENAE